MAVAKIKCVIPFRLSQISCFTLQQPQMLHLYPKQMPQYGNLTPASPPPTGADPVLLTLLFFVLIPLSCQVLCGSVYSFLVVKSSCPLSDGVLQDLLCLEVYS